MAVVEVKCRYCGGCEVNKAGVRSNGIQRFRCLRCNKYFQLEYRYNGHKPGIAGTIVDMAINGSGVRDTSRVLKISQNTVIRRLKKISQSPGN